MRMLLVIVSFFSVPLFLEAASLEPMKEYYNILGLVEGFSLKDIEEKFEKLQNQDLDFFERQKIKEAYGALKAEKYKKIQRALQDKKEKYVKENIKKYVNEQIQIFNYFSSQNNWLDASESIHELLMIKDQVKEVPNFQKNIENAKKLIQGQIEYIFVRLNPRRPDELSKKLEKILTFYQNEQELVEEYKKFFQGLINPEYVDEFIEKNRKNLHKYFLG